MNDEMYSYGIDFGRNNYEYGVVTLLKNKGFYDLLSPWHKSELFDVLFQKTFHKFVYFFNDYE